MLDPITTATSIASAAKTLDTAAGKSFLKTVSIYSGVEIKQAENRGKAKKVEEWAYEKESIKIDLHERPKLKLEMAKKLEDYQKKFEWNNLLATVSKAVKHLKPKVNKSKDVNFDSLKLLFDEAKNVSDEEMQEYIAKILAGEYNEPNSVSRQTIRIVQSMTKKDFELFEKYSALFWDGNILPQAYFDIGNIEISKKMDFYMMKFYILKV